MQKISGAQEALLKNSLLQFLRDKRISKGRSVVWLWCYEWFWSKNWHLILLSFTSQQFEWISLQIFWTSLAQDLMCWTNKTYAALSLESNKAIVPHFSEFLSCLISVLQMSSLIQKKRRHQAVFWKTYYSIQELQI